MSRLRNTVVQVDMKLASVFTVAEEAVEELLLVGQQPVLVHVHVGGYVAGLGAKAAAHQHSPSPEVSNIRGGQI